jgi:ribonucleotide monophosphatase NagD (HAD superfamily)
VSKDDVIFVGNQLNTNVRGGEDFGIRTVWVSGADYRSDDDHGHEGCTASYTIQRLGELAPLFGQISIRGEKVG